MTEATYVPGLYLNESHPKAPSFVKGSIGIHPSTLVKWIEQQPRTEKGYLDVRIELLESKEGKLYLKLNDYKSEEGQGSGDDLPF